MSATTPYIASVNPPRRAKRQPGVDAAPVPSGSAISRPHPPILPKQREDHDDALSDSADEDEYDPPKRRGRKRGAGSRSARESLRKLNHSRIEKARRTKINDTLSTLSALVSDDTAAATAGTGKSKNEKEFKLDVLVKTVDYIQTLLARVRTLEAQAQTTCTHCRAPLTPDSEAERGREGTPGLKRKRAVADHSVGSRKRREDSYGGDDEHEDPPLTPYSNSSARPTPTLSPRLPPIASWLPHPHLDPSALMLPPSAQQTSPKAGSQLPSPPPSGALGGGPPHAGALATMPALALPGPAHPLPLPLRAAPAKIPALTLPGPAHRTRRTSPLWTPEDESAASLLLQMSTSPTVSARRDSLVETPSSLLGMRD